MATQYKGIEYLKNKLSQKATRAKTRYDFYDMKSWVEDFGISTPPDLRAWMGALGWCGKAVDSLADRLVFREFKNDYLDFNGILDANNPDVLCDSAVLDALISSCSFIYITTELGEPRMRVIDGAHATGIIDPITMMLKEGYAVLEYDDGDKPILEAYCIPGCTYIYKEGILTQRVPNVAPYPLLVPIVYRPNATRPFGHSRISRACMSIVGSALRTAKRSEICAEFYSYPQKYVLGLDKNNNEKDFDRWKATISSMLRFGNDRNGNHPVVGQFQQATMTPHLDQLRMFAGLFAGETDLTLDDLGFPSVNPSSAEAIKASHDNLRLKARKAQRSFGTGIMNAMFLAACLRDGNTYEREIMASIRPKWEPIFAVDASMLSTIGNGILQLNQAMPGYINDEMIADMTGIYKEKTDEIINPNAVIADLDYTEIEQEETDNEQ